MARIRERVAAKAAPWDTRAGLLLKAFCVTEAGSGDGHNSYAPFYVWADTAEFSSFLTGAEYAGLCSAFGPVPVRTGAVIQLSHGTGPAAYLVTESEGLGPVTNLRAVAETEQERHRAALRDPAVHSHITELDPVAMTVTRRTLLRAGQGAPEPKSGARVLRVLHPLPAPHPYELTPSHICSCSSTPQAALDNAVDPWVSDPDKERTVTSTPTHAPEARPAPPPSRKSVLERTAGFAQRHRWTALVLWLVILVGVCRAGASAASNRSVTTSPCRGPRASRRWTS